MSHRGFKYNYSSPSSAGAHSAEWKKQRSKGAIALVVTVLIVFVMLAGVLIRSSQISNMTQQNAAIERSNAELQSQISEVQMQIALREDLNNVQDRAAAIGMEQPSDAQIVYVDLSDENALEAQAVSGMQDAGQPAQTQNFFSAFGDWLRAVLGL